MMRERTYTTTRVCAAAGIKAAMLRTWCARGLVIVAKEEEKEWTRYSELEALRVCVLASLRRSGVDLQVAAEAIENIDMGDKRLRDGKPIYLVVSMVDADLSGRGRTGMLAEFTRAVDRELFSDDPSDAVAIVVNMAKLIARALTSLKADT